MRLPYLYLIVNIYAHMCLRVASKLTQKRKSKVFIIDIHQKQSIIPILEKRTTNFPKLFFLVINIFNLLRALGHQHLND